jgi:hypothetical protein
MYRSSAHFWATFSTIHTYKLCINFAKKTVWATFWVILQQTDLVALAQAMRHLHSVPDPILSLFLCFGTYDILA